MNVSATKSFRNACAQSGAALVVALILLVALSLMAIASMNTATLDLIMAGNEQFRSRSFLAAETGIERALIAGTFDTSMDVAATTPAATGYGSDKYSYAITRPNNGATEGAPPGYSQGAAGSGDAFGTVHFRITSNGVSERDTRSQNAQELYLVIRAGSSLTCDASLPTCSLD